MIIFLLCILIHFSPISFTTVSCCQGSEKYKIKFNQIASEVEKIVSAENYEKFIRVSEIISNKQEEQNLICSALLFVYNKGVENGTKEKSHFITNIIPQNQNLQSLLKQYAKDCSNLKKTGFCVLGTIVFGSLLYSGISLYTFGKQKYSDWKRKNTTD